MANPTADEIIKQAQVFANDKAGTKYDPVQGLAYLNTAIQLLFQRHPSAFYVTAIVTDAPSAVGMNDDVPVATQFTVPLASYVAAMFLTEGAAGNDQFNARLAKTQMDLFNAA